MKLVFLAHTAMGGDFVVGSHQLAKVLARKGHQVIHIGAPLSIPHLSLLASKPFVRRRLKRWMRGGELIDGVTDVAPLTALPWRVAQYSSALAGAYSRHMLAGPLQGLAALGLDTADCVILDDPRFVGLATRKPGRTLIYRATDLYAQMHRDPDMVEIERIICARADVLVATSEPVASHLGKLSPREVHIITNGADFEHFTANPPARGRHRYSLPGKREDRAVYVGSFDRRFDGEMLRQAARTLADKQFILVGPGGRSIAAALSTPNITSPGAIDYAELPQLLSQCAVGLLPMSSDPANDGRSPMKLYEYVAAGLSIAATSTVELRRHSLATLCLSGKGTPFATAVSQAFDRARDLSLLNAARAAASNEDWAIKADTLLELVGRGD